jgi:DNA repair exonuclease SbcCD ATPase subunit
MLDQIRVFSDTDSPGGKIFSCIFAGQPEFLETIRKNRALSQRIFFSHTLQPLTREETADYIAHRLKVAGRKEPIFTPAALIEIFRLSQGNPRLTNIICDQALLAAYSAGKTEIGPELIREGTESTLVPLQPARKGQAEPLENASRAVQEQTGADGLDVTTQVAQAPRGRRKAYFAALAAAVVLVFGAFVYRDGDGNRAFLPWGTPHAADDGGNLRRQVDELQRQKDAAEARLKDLQASVARREGEPKGPQGAGERAAESEKAVALKDATIAELRQKLELSATNQAAGSKQLEPLQKEISRLQAMLAETNGQRDALEARLAEGQKAASELSADAKALKGARERAAQLEAAVSERDKRLAQLEQAATELAKATASEKAAKDQASAELASHQAAIADIQKKLEAAGYLQLKLEAEIQNARSDNARLQAQLQVLKTRPQPPAAPSTAAPPQQEAPPAPAQKGRVEGPDPVGIIDYVIKRKTQ